VTLSNEQFKKQVREEEKIKRRGLVNPNTGYVGNGFWWNGYTYQTDEYNGYGGVDSAPQNPPMHDTGATAAASDGGGVSAVGGMAVN
jgi:hypothetical protein